MPTGSLKWCFLSLGLGLPLTAAAFLGSEHYSGLAFWFMVYVNVVVFALMTKTSHGPVDVLEPYYAVLALYSLYAWTSALVEVTAHGSFLPIMPIYYRCVVLGAVGFTLGYQYIHHSGLDLIRRVTAFRPDISFKPFYRILVCLAIVLAIVEHKSLIDAFDIGSIRPYTEAATASRMGRTASSGVFEYVQHVSILLILGSLFLRSFVRNRLSLVGVVFFGVYAVVGIMAGGKSLVIQFATLLLVYYNYNVKRVRFVPVAVCGLILLPFCTLINYVRTTTSIPEMMRASVGFVREDVLFLTPLSSGEFVGPPRMLMNVIDSIEHGSMGFSLGSTCVCDLATLIPRILYPDRPLPVPERYMEIFHPGVLSEGKTEGNFMLLEGYWALGYAGVVMVMFAYGAVVSIAYEILKNNIDNGVVVFVYSLAYFPLVTTAIRTGLVGAIKGTAMVVVPFALIVFVSRECGRLGQRLRQSDMP